MRRLGDAYRTARKLGARPLASEVARERNILRKLDCRSRVEAAGRARELGLTG
jgi:hypothetical protein